MIQFIEQYSITKGFGRKFNYKVSARQELIALGICNIAGSFYGGWPVCGSFSRSAVNSMSGAQTPLAGMTILHIMSCGVVCKLRRAPRRACVLIKFCYGGRGIKYCEAKVFRFTVIM